MFIIKAIRLKLHKVKKQKLISRDIYIKRGESFLGCLSIKPPHEVLRAYNLIVHPYFLQPLEEGKFVLEYIFRINLDKEIQPTILKLLYSYA